MVDAIVHLQELPGKFAWHLHIWPKNTQHPSRFQKFPSQAMSLQADGPGGHIWDMCCLRLIHNWLMIPLLVVVAGGGGGTKWSRRSTVVNAAVALAFFSASSTRENDKNSTGMLDFQLFSRFSDDKAMQKWFKTYVIPLYHIFGVWTSIGDRGCSGSPNWGSERSLNFSLTNLTPTCNRCILAEDICVSHKHRKLTQRLRAVQFFITWQLRFLSESMAVADTFSSSSFFILWHVLWRPNLQQSESVCSNSSWPLKLRASQQSKSQSASQKRC